MTDKMMDERSLEASATCSDDVMNDKRGISIKLKAYLHAPSGISQWIQHVETVRKRHASKTLVKILRSHLVF
jgi:hypothetical protein